MFSIKVQIKRNKTYSTTTTLLNMAKGNTTGKGKATTHTKAPLKKLTPKTRKAPRPLKKALMKKKGPQKRAADDSRAPRSCPVQFFGHFLAGPRPDWS